METMQEFLQVSGFEPTTFRPEQSSEDSTAFWDVSKFFWISFLSVAKAIRFGSKWNWLDILSYLVWISFLLYVLFQIRIIKSMLVQISPLPPHTLIWINLVGFLLKVSNELQHPSMNLQFCTMLNSCFMVKVMMVCAFPGTPCAA